jgi:YggT family protein
VGLLLRNFTEAIAYVLSSLLTVYMYVLIAAAVLSWVNPDPNNPIVRFLRAVTDPVLYRVRRSLPFVHAGGIDFSPLVVIAGIWFVQIFVVRSLYELAAQIGTPSATGIPLG